MASEGSCVAVADPLRARSAHDAVVVDLQDLDVGVVFVALAELRKSVDRSTGRDNPLATQTWVALLALAILHLLILLPLSFLFLFFFILFVSYLLLFLILPPLSFLILLFIFPLFLILLSLSFLILLSRFPLLFLRLPTTLPLPLPLPLLLLPLLSLSLPLAFVHNIIKRQASPEQRRIGGGLQSTRPLGLVENWFIGRRLVVCNFLWRLAT